MKSERNNDDLKWNDFIPIFGMKYYIDRNIDKVTSNYFEKSTLLAIYNSTFLTLGVIFAGEGLAKLLYN